MGVMLSCGDSAGGGRGLAREEKMAEAEVCVAPN